MAHHYNRYVVSDRVNCKTCEKSTDHAVINGRLAHCLDCYDRRQKQSAEKLALPQQQGLDFRGVAS
jgi:hypothetical protein